MAPVRAVSEQQEVQPSARPLLTAGGSTKRVPTADHVFAPVRYLQSAALGPPNEIYCLRISIAQIAIYDWSPTTAVVKVLEDDYPDDNVFMPELLGRQCYFRAWMPWSGSEDEEVGGCGMQMVVCDENGLNKRRLARGPGLKPRPIVLGEIFVARYFRRQGLAKRMLRELEGRARRWGATELLLPCKSHNTPAIRLYEKMGYSPTPAFRGQKAGEICMRRNIWSPTHHTLLSMMPQRTTLTMY